LPSQTGSFSFSLVVARMPIVPTCWPPLPLYLFSAVNIFPLGISSHPQDSKNSHPHKASQPAKVPNPQTPLYLALRLRAKQSLNSSSLPSFCQLPPNTRRPLPLAHPAGSAALPLKLARRVPPACILAR
jgi:hypothetical protein